MTPSVFDRRVGRTNRKLAPENCKLKLPGTNSSDCVSICFQIISGRGQGDDDHADVGRIVGKRTKSNSAGRFFGCTVNEWKAHCDHMCNQSSLMVLLEKRSMRVTLTLVNRVTVGLPVVNGVDP